MYTYMCCIYLINILIGLDVIALNFQNRIQTNKNTGQTKRFEMLTYFKRDIIPRGDILDPIDNSNLATCLYWSQVTIV